MPAVSKEQFKKIAQLCSEGKMKPQDCKDYLKAGYYKSLPNRKMASLDNLPNAIQEVHYERKTPSN